MNTYHQFVCLGVELDLDASLPKEKDTFYKIITVVTVFNSK